MSDPVSSGFQAAGGVISGIGNIVLGAKQLKLQREQFNYQKELNNTMMQREDNAVQRRAADMANAGINKNLAAGAPASANPMSVGQPLGADGGAIMQEGFSQLGQIPSQAIGLGMQVSKSLAEIDNMDAQAANQSAMERLNIAKAATEAKQQGLITAKTGREYVEAALASSLAAVNTHNLEKSQQFGIRTNDTMGNVVRDSQILNQRKDGKDSLGSIAVQAAHEAWDLTKGFLGAAADAQAKSTETNTYEDTEILTDPKTGNKSVVRSKSEKKKPRRLF